MPLDHVKSGPGEPTYLAAYKTMSNFRNHVLYVQFSATGLPAKDSLLHGGKADPFFHVMKAHGMVKSKAGEFTLFSTPVPGEYMGDDQQIPVYDGKSQVVKNTLNPKWKAFEISNFSSLCEDGDIRHPILIDIWDFNWYKDNTFMGYVVTSVYDLFEKHARGESIQLMPGRPGQKWGGVLHVDHIELIAKTGSYNQFVESFRTQYRALDSVDHRHANSEGIRRLVADTMLQIIAGSDGSSAADEAYRRLKSITLSPMIFTKECGATLNSKISWEEFWAAIRFKILEPLLPDEEVKMSAVYGDTAFQPSSKRLLHHIIERQKPSFLTQYKENPHFRNHSIYLKFSATDLPGNHSLLKGGKADPFLRIRKGHGIVKSGSGYGAFTDPTPGQYMGEQELEPLYDGKLFRAKNTTSPRWRAIEISKMSRLCDDGNIHKPILIDVWGYDWYKANAFMGFVLISIFDLMAKAASGEPIALKPGRPGHSWGGFLHIDKLDILSKDGKYFQMQQSVRSWFDSLPVTKSGVNLQVARQSIYETMTSAIETIEQHHQSSKTDALRRLRALTRDCGGDDDEPFAFCPGISSVTWEDFWTVVRFGVLDPLLPEAELRASAVVGDRVLSPLTAQILDQLTCAFSASGRRSQGV